MSDQHTKGAVNEAKGAVKEAAGRVSGDRKLETKGEAQKVQGKVQGHIGVAADAVSGDRHI